MSARLPLDVRGAGTEIGQELVAAGERPLAVGDPVLLRVGPNLDECTAAGLDPGTLELLGVDVQPLLIGGGDQVHVGSMVGLNCGLSSVGRWIGWRNGSDRHGALSAGDRALPTPLVGRLPVVSDQQAYERERLS